MVDSPNCWAWRVVEGDPAHALHAHPQSQGCACVDCLYSCQTGPAQEETSPWPAVQRTSSVGPVDVMDGRRCSAPAHTHGADAEQGLVQHGLQRAQVHPGALVRPEVGRVGALWQAQLRRGVRLVACSSLQLRDSSCVCSLWGLPLTFGCLAGAAVRRVRHRRCAGRACRLGPPHVLPVGQRVLKVGFVEVRIVRKGVDPLRHQSRAERAWGSGPSAPHMAWHSLPWSWSPILAPQSLPAGLLLLGSSRH